MRHANKTITIFNHYYNVAEDKDYYYPTVIHGVSLHGTAIAAATNSGLAVADTFTVRIPSESLKKPYISSLNYLTNPMPTQYVTFAIGDIIAVGEGNEPLTSKQIEERYTAYTVMSVTDNRNGRTPHIKVVAK